MRASRALIWPSAAVVALAVAVVSPATRAQELRGGAAADVPDRTPDRTVLALARALEQRMTVWRSDSRVIYVRHCRDAPGGCRERMGEFARMMGDAASESELDPFLLGAMAVRESGMNPLAAGPAGERGIVQLHPRGPAGRVSFVRSEAHRARCARQPGVCQDEVLRAGARLLARSIQRCGSVRAALGAYNSGTCGDTDYTRRVMSERQRLLRLAKGDARSASVN